jgi:hypothetical protein
MKIIVNIKVIVPKTAKLISILFLPLSLVKISCFFLGNTNSLGYE